MSTGPLALAFTAGMVATFNPCGFSLLPAYVGAFVAGDDVDQRPERRVLRAIQVAAAVSIGFVVVFSAIGVVIESLSGQVRSQLPWITIAVGLALAVAGAAMVAGWSPRVALPAVRPGRGATNLSTMVGYGAAYAVASLSCTIGPFLAVTGTAVAGSTREGALNYVAYALGMGSIILVLSVATALAHSTVAHHMRRFARVAPRVGGALMVLAGAYAVWYGRWELAVYDGDLRTDPLVDAVEDLRLALVDLIQSVGALRIALLTVAVVLAGLLAARRLRPVDDEPASSSSSFE